MEYLSKKIPNQGVKVAEFNKKMSDLARRHLQNSHRNIIKVRAAMTRYSNENFVFSWNSQTKNDFISVHLYLKGAIWLQ